jgi:metal-responsive CopG/Arc/MetJ family transcriptional regulator
MIKYDQVIPEEVMRTTKVLSVTLPSPMLLEAQELARRENRTMSELIREALRQYQSRKRWETIGALGQASAEMLYLKTEEDVVRLIHDFRKEQAEPKGQD